MDKVVLDTNIWISAIFFGGKLEIILNAWKEEKFTVVFSQETFLEAENKLMFWGKKLNAEKEVAQYVLALNQNALFVYPEKQFTLCRDLKDNMLLSAAYGSEAKYLVSGDKDLLVLEKIGKTKIIGPKVFLSLLS